MTVITEHVCAPSARDSSRCRHCDAPIEATDVVFARRFRGWLERDRLIYGPYDRHTADFIDRLRLDLGVGQ